MRENTVNTINRITKVAILCVSIIAQGQALANKKTDPLPLPEITGRLTDEQRRPVSGAQVSVSNEKGVVIATEETDKNGSFAIHHEACVICNLDVVPDEKSGLASAFVENIPGGITRRFLFTLQKGFRINGRVVSQGRGVKAISVKVISADEEGSSKVHSGGAAKTARDGSFALTLTPGKKHMTVSNSKYSEANGHFEKDFEVLCDTTLDDISLSSSR
ncbi:MAG: carboxypeptidase-like regulatory domain-containing protein [Candidatus Obscuribacterales bacterium]|nr:carboxypeptidase-like regulatory domain-containing protein [Candidatus Obscuribacterales bacterium]